MDPMTILSLAKGATWAWGQYKQKSAASPANSIDELRARLDASDELVRNSFELIEAMEQQIHDHGSRTGAQATADVTPGADHEITTATMSLLAARLGGKPAS